MTGEHVPIPLRDVIVRLWRAMLGRQALGDNTGYGWCWKDIRRGSGERDTNSDFLGPSNDDPD